MTLTVLEQLIVAPEQCQNGWLPLLGPGIPEAAVPRAIIVWRVDGFLMAVGTKWEGLAIPNDRKIVEQSRTSVCPSTYGCCCSRRCDRSLQVIPQNRETMYCPDVRFCSTNCGLTRQYYGIDSEVE